MFKMMQKLLIKYIDYIKIWEEVRLCKVEDCRNEQMIEKIVDVIVVMIKVNLEIFKINIHMLIC